MSDYLGQLVLRVRQPDVAVQPRLLSRFEQPRRASLDAPDLSTSGESEPLGPHAPAVTPSDSGALVSAQEVDRGRRPKPARAGSSLEADSAPSVYTLRSGELIEAPRVVTQRIGKNPVQATGREAEQPAGDSRTPGADPRAHRTTEAVEPEPRVERPAATVRRALSSAPGLEVPVEPIRRVIKAQERQIRPMASPPDGHATGLPGKSESEESRERPRSDGRVDLRPASDLVPMRSRELFRPPVSPAVTLPDVDRAQVPDAPVIQVTIGRVEIRATAAQTPARKPPV